MTVMTWTKVTSDRYWEMLEVLPPAVMTSAGFLVGEAWRHDEQNRPMFAAFVEINGEYYEADGPMTVAQFRALKREDVLQHTNAAQH